MTVMHSQELTLMNRKSIDDKEANEILESWASRSLPVCFAVCLGDIAWHAHSVGIIRSAGSGRGTLTSGTATNMVSTDQYEEIILTEDDELIGIRFRKPHGLEAAGFEVDLFVDKYDGRHERFGPLINRIIQ
jgi:hypothetical protein